MKIFHTADLHIGMKFKSYGALAKPLADAREEQLGALVDIANSEKCDLFVITGDLFDSLYVSEKQIKSVCGALSRFSGAAAVVLPGNHDCFDGSGRLWRAFEDAAYRTTHVLHTFEPLILETLDAAVHGAYCECPHSAANHVNDVSPVEGFFNIALAHGSIDGLSPDGERRYFPMTRGELEKSPMDLWLLGHTHVSYPDTRSVSSFCVSSHSVSGKIFNAGTPEPDGWDCTRGGNAWIIDTDGEIRASAVETGKYRFYDINKTVRTVADMDSLIKRLQCAEGDSKLLRLTLSGSCDGDLWERRESYFEKIRETACYVEERYDGLHKQINADDIRTEFAEESFPYLLLSRFFDDEDTLRIAYDAVKEAGQ